MSSRWLRSLLCVLPLLAVACGEGGGGFHPAAETAPTVREIQPTGGPIAGNTLINVYGSGFQEGAKLYLGEQEALRTVVVNAFRIYGYTPTSTSAKVDVRVVNPSGAYGVLVKGFTFEGPPVPSIAQAEVINGNREEVSNGAPVGVAVEGSITVPGLTRGTGQGPGVRAQVGFAPGTADVLRQESYTWEAATYVRDSDSGEADIYRGNVLLQPPIGGENREWVIALRFSIDGGKTWVMADGDGVANGLSASLMRRVFIARPRVDYCKLGPDNNRASLDLFYRPTDTTLTKVVGQVFAAGITPGAGAGSGLTAQLGFGPANSDPRDANAGWTWINAAFKGDIGSNDEFEAELPNPQANGTYRVAMRFSISENTWRVCDVNGVNDSTSGDLTFDLNRLGILTVGAEPPKPPVDWCKLGDNNAPPEVINYQTNTSGTGLKTVLAQVHMAGVTPPAGPGPGIVAELGWGPAGSDPRETDSGWRWSAMTFSRNRFDANDEWQGTLPNPGILGTYRYAVRFSANGGPVRVCDGNGHNNSEPFELDQLGRLSVTGEPVVQRVIGYCKLGPDGNNTPQSLTYATGAPASHTVVAQVFADGVTNGNTQGTGIVAQWGMGPADANPSTWTWTTTTTYKGSIGDNDEYEVTLPNPGTAGNYRFAFRFQVNGGAFLMCDADGNTGTLTGFEVSKTGTLAVVEPQSITVGWCKLGAPGETPVPNEVYRVGQATKDILAQVWMQNVTPGNGAGTGIQGQVGYGLATDNPSDPAGSWVWTSTGAVFNRETGGGGSDDEWRAPLPNPGVPGNYKFAFRFNYNGGAYQYCDSDGLAAGGFTMAQAGNLVVRPVAVDECRVVGPTALSATPGGTTQVVSGQVLVTTVTDIPDGGVDAGIIAEMGHGPEGSNPAAGGWNWTEASFAGDAQNAAQDLYETALTAPAAEGTYSVAARFRYQTGAPVYCDLDGSGNGYQTAQAPVLTVAAVVPPTVDWCRLGGVTAGPPPAATYAVGETGSTVVRVQVNEPNANTTVRAQLGYGPVGVPQTDDAWRWRDATYVAHTGNGDHEFQATLPNPGTGGSYRFAYRVHLEGGPYLYCDADGTDMNGFTLAQAGTLEVLTPGVCKLQSVSGPTVSSGDTVTVTGRVRIPGVTDSAGEGANIDVEVGLGAANVNASTTPGAFTWKAATYSADADSATDEFSTTLQPAYTGERHVSVRYRLGNEIWTYCDEDGSDVDGYSRERQYPLTVNNHTSIDYCNLQHPERRSQSSSDRTIYGRIYENGVTPLPPPTQNLTAEFGYGPKQQDPGVGTGWTWLPGTVNSDNGDADEYRIDLPAEAPVGSSYLWRYRVGTGPYCFGDWQPNGAGGSSNGVSQDTLGTVDP